MRNDFILVAWMSFEDRFHHSADDGWDRQFMLAGHHNRPPFEMRCHERRGECGRIGDTLGTPPSSRLFGRVPGSIPISRPFRRLLCWMSVSSPITIVRSMHERDITGLLAANDPLLGPLIAAERDDTRRHALEAVLVRHARPVAQKVLAQHRDADRVLGRDEAEDIVSTVMLRLVRKLQNVPFDESGAVARLGDFTATLTFNTIYDFMRSRFPEWTHLKNRVRYVLTRDRRFVTWNVPAGNVCALQQWLVSGVAPVPPPEESWRGLDRDRPADAIATILQFSGGPLLIDDMVRSLARTWNITDVPADVDIDQLGHAATHATELESRSELEALWREINELRAPQRAALLLNLRDVDGGNAIALFAMIGIATLDQIAGAIEFPLTEIAAMWDRLPLDDLEIAAILGVKRQHGSA